MSSDYTWLEEMLTGPEVPTRAAALAAQASDAKGIRGADVNRSADLMFRLTAESLRSLEPTLGASSPLLSTELLALERCADALVLLAAETLQQ